MALQHACPALETLPRADSTNAISAPSFHEIHTCVEYYICVAIYHNALRKYYNGPAGCEDDQPAGLVALGALMAP